MTPVNLIEAIREPPPDSLVGLMTRADGRVMRTMPFVILFNLAWVFFWPVIARESFLHVILPTILSVPVFVWLHLCTYYTSGGPAVRRRYVASIVALGYLLTYFNLAALGYLIFSFFTAAFSNSVRNACLWIAATIAGYLLEVALLGNNTKTLLIMALPAVLLGISAVYTAYTTFQQAKLRRSARTPCRKWRWRASRCTKVSQFLLWRQSTS